MTFMTFDPVAIRALVTQLREDDREMGLRWSTRGFSGEIVGIPGHGPVSVGRHSVAMFVARIRNTLPAIANQLEVLLDKVERREAEIERLAADPDVGSVHEPKP